MMKIKSVLVELSLPTKGDPSLRINQSYQRIKAVLEHPATYSLFFP